MVELPITVLLNKKGVTLVEMMIALVILLLVFLALMQVALVSIDHNLRNALRDEAVSIAEQRLTELRDKPFTDGSLTDTSNSFVSDATIPRTFRDLSINFISTKKIKNNTTSKDITIKVTWTWKAESFSHTVTTIKRSE